MWQPYLLLLLCCYGLCANAYTTSIRDAEAPGNFTVIQIISSEAVVLGWTNVPINSLNSHRKGYKIMIWPQDDPEQIREIHVKSDAHVSLVSNLKPVTNYFAHIMVYNEHYIGPASNIVSFTTPEGRPGAVETLEAVPLGSSALWLSWKPPLITNGQLTGYKIFYEISASGYSSPKIEREPYISDSRTTSAFLGGLYPNTKYRITIQATTKAGASSDYYIEQKTGSVSDPIVPDTPNFACESVPNDKDYDNVKVQWLPAGSRAGSNFYAKYRKKDEPNWETVNPELNEDNLVIRSLDLNSTYEIRVAASDQQYTTESQSQFIGGHGNKKCVYNISTI